MSTSKADGLSLDTVEFVTADGTRKKFSPLRSLNWHSLTFVRAVFGFLLFLFFFLTQLKVDDGSIVTCVVSIWKGHFKKRERESTSGG